MGLGWFEFEHSSSGPMFFPHDVPLIPSLLKHMFHNFAHKPWGIASSGHEKIALAPQELHPNGFRCRPSGQGQKHRKRKRERCADRCIRLCLVAPRVSYGTQSLSAAAWPQSMASSAAAWPPFFPPVPVAP